MTFIKVSSMSKIIVFYPILNLIKFSLTRYLLREKARDAPVLKEELIDLGAHNRVDLHDLEKL